MVGKERVKFAVKRRRKLMKKTKRRERRGAYERDFSGERGRDTLEGGKHSRKPQKDHNSKD